MENHVGVQWLENHVGAKWLELQPPNFMVGSSTLINPIFGVFVWIYAFGYKFSVSSLWKFPYGLRFPSYPLTHKG